MEKKILAYDPHLCTGCMYCMTACSTHNEGSTSLSKGRLKIIRHEGHALTRTDEQDELIFTFVGCQQCEDPACSVVCPTGALRRDASTGAMVIHREECDGCRMCLVECPFGAISFNQKNKQVFKCELCNGDPLCVKFCQPQALRFVSARDAPLPKRSETAKKSMEGWEKGAAVSGKREQK
jgi:anaerobic carbon-monoxide dehydrogenase iron sulfur subunit